MRTRILAVALAAAALVPVSVLAAVPASAATAHDVLTIGKLGGPNVKVKAVLSASLAKKSAVVFAASGGTSLTCTKSTFTTKVVKNPPANGTALESLTGQTFSGCSASGPFKPDIKSVTVSLFKPPYGVTVSGAKGNKVIVSKPSAKVVVVTPPTLVGTLTCIYSAKSITGSTSNKAQTVSFSKQTLTLVTKISSKNCSLLPSAKFSATYGPVVDTSVKGKPHVYVN
jgi:hypothetical protein